MVRIVNGPDGPLILDDYDGVDPLSGRLAFPDHGYPPRPGEEAAARTPWARTSRGGNLGQAEQFPYDADADARSRRSPPWSTRRGTTSTPPR